MLIVDIIVCGDVRQMLTERTFNDIYISRCHFHQSIKCHFQLFFFRQNTINMYLVAYLLKLKENVVLPIKYLQNMQFSKLAEHGVNSEEKVVLFYSKNTNEDPDFQLEPDANDLSENNTRGCFYARILKFFSKLNKMLFCSTPDNAHFFYCVDTEEQAKSYCVFKRDILPNTYSSKKVDQAFIWNGKSQEPIQNAPDDNTNVEDKESVREEIQQKINAMNNLDDIEVYDDSDIEDLQSIIGNDENDPDFFSPANNETPNRNQTKIVHYSMDWGEQNRGIQNDDVNWLLHEIKLHIPQQYSCTYVSLF